MNLFLDKVRVRLEGFTLEIDATFKFPVTGIFGPSGSGKTSLLETIAGLRRPISGKAKLNDTILFDAAVGLHLPPRLRRIGYVPQDLALFPHLNVEANLLYGYHHHSADNHNLTLEHVVEVMEISDLVDRDIGSLSGGERNRLHLAKLLRRGSNLLLLDEPTNDLDVDTLRALEEALLAYAGCAVVISHDRWFLNRIATHMLAFEGDSSVVWFEGNYDDYEADRKRRLGAAAEQPHRIKYRRLTR